MKNLNMNRESLRFASVFQRLGGWLVAVLVFVSASSLVAAQETASSTKPDSTITSVALTQAQIDDIIRKVTAKETQFRRTLYSYAFKRDALVQEIGMGGQVIGE